MPSNSLARNPNKTKKRLPETLPTGTKCVKVYIPDNIEYVGYLLGAIGRLSQQVFYDRDDEHTAKKVADLWKEANQQTYANLGGGCDCAPINPPTGTAPGTVPMCIDIRTINGEIIIDIEECGMPVTVNIYEGCGCGCGGATGAGHSSGGFGGGSSSGGGASGSWIQEPENQQTYGGIGITDCDFLTGGAMDFIIDQQKEIMTLVDGAAGGGIDNILDALAAAVNTLSLGTITPEGVSFFGELAEEALDSAIALWIDVDFRDAVKAAWVKTFPNAYAVTSVTRQELLSIADNFRQVWYVSTYPVEARVLWRGLTRVLNMTKINQRLAVAKGNCNQSNYNYYKALAGVPYTPPTDPSTIDNPFPTVAGLLELYDWAHVYDFRVNQMVLNSYFQISTAHGESKPVSIWEEGMGYIEQQNIYVAPHAKALNRLELISATGGGYLEYVAVDYKFNPSPTFSVSSSVEHKILGNNYDMNTPFDGVRQYLDLHTALNIGLSADPDRDLNTTTNTGDGHSVWRRIAIAGTGSDIFDGLEVVS